MNALSLLLSDPPANRAPLPSELISRADTASAMPRGNDAPVPFETVLRRHARETHREESDRREEGTNEQRNDAAPPAPGDAPAPGGANPPPAPDAGVEAAAADLATSLPFQGVGDGWAAVADLAALGAAGESVAPAPLPMPPGAGLPTGSNALPVAACGLPATDPTTLLPSGSAGTSASAVPLATPEPQGIGGRDVRQIASPLGGRWRAVSEGAGPAAEAGGGDLAALPFRAGTWPGLDSAQALSVGRETAADLRAFVNGFAIRRGPGAQLHGQESAVAPANVANGVGTPFPMEAPAPLGSQASSPVRPVAEQLAPRLVAWADVTTTEGRTVFHLRLEPPELGSVRVQLSAHAGAISAKLVASTEAAGQILQSQLHELRQSLTKLGVSFTSLDVSYGQDGSQGPAQQRELQPYPWPESSRPVLEQPAVVWQRRSRPAALIDVLV